VTVRIYDAGRNVPSPKVRYHAEAESDDGRSASGNPHDSIYGVLMTLHWRNLGE